MTLKSQSHSTSQGRQVLLVVGSNRTGTSLLVEILIEAGFKVPGKQDQTYSDYATYESEQFKAISRNWDTEAARQFANSLRDHKYVLKYPKASYVIKRWLKLIPDARVVYVFRRREAAVESNLRYSWNGRPLTWLMRWVYRWEWIRGLLAVSNLQAPVAFVAFEELKLTRRFEIPKNFGWD